MQIQNAKIVRWGLRDSEYWSQSLELWIELKLQEGGGVIFTFHAPYTETWPNNRFAYGIKKLLDIVGVSKLEDILNKPIRAKFKVDGFAGDTIEGIGHFLDDEWFIPSEEKLWKK